MESLQKKHQRYELDRITEDMRFNLLISAIIKLNSPSIWPYYLLLASIENLVVHWSAFEEPL